MTSKLWIGVVLLVLAPAAHASFNNSNSPTSTAASSVSESMTVLAPCLPNCAAFVWVTTVSTGAYPTVTASYGGNSMISAGTPEQETSGNFYQVAWFYLANPPTGSNTLVIGTSGGTVSVIKTSLTSYTGVNQTTPVRAASYTGASATAATIALTISSNAADLTTSATITDSTAANLFGSSQNPDAIENSGNAAGGDHALAPASSVTDTWTYDRSSDLIAAGFSIDGAAAFAPICSGSYCIQSVCPINYWFDGISGSKSCTLTVAPGETIVGAIFTYATTTCPDYAWSDSLGLIYTVLDNQCPSGPNMGPVVFAGEVATTGANSGPDTFTLQNNQFGYAVSLVMVVSGLSALDTSAGSSATSGTALSSGNLTTAVGGEFLLNMGVAYVGPPLAAGAGFTLIGSVGTYEVDEAASSYAVYAEFKTTGGAGMYSGTFTADSSSTWADVAAAFGVTPVGVSRIRGPIY